MENKIGIVAPFKDYNYGTVLQAYALYYSFKRIGIESEYINYIPFDGSESVLDKLRVVLRHPSIIYSKYIKKKNINPIVSFFSTPSFAPIKEQYDKFISRIPSSKVITYRDLRQLSNHYASFCVGSDQTWSPYVVSPLSINFLSFVQDKLQKNSYASSIGTSRIPFKHKLILKRRLSNFNILSCRDFWGTELLSDLLKRDVVNVLDPTLLMDENDWASVIEPVLVPNHYILLYQLGVKKELLLFAKKLHDKFGYPIVVVPTNEYTSSLKGCLRVVSPGQFLYLVQNASYVVTDSFHGTIFSINFGTQVYAFSKVSGSINSFDNIRIVEVLSIFGMQNRFVSDSDFKLQDDIKYSIIKEVLKCRVETSMDVLYKISKTVFDSTIN